MRDRGRLMPPGLEYISSWITEDLTTCWQVMRCDDRSLLHQWMANWEDVMTFEVVPVITSAEAIAATASRLQSPAQD